MASTLLITGSSGFLGEHLVRRLVNEQKYSLIAFDRSECPAHKLIQNNGGKVIFLPNDIRLEHLERSFSDIGKIQIDAVIHCAAMSSFSACETAPGLAHRVNSEYTALMCNLAERLQAYFLYISTDLVFDGNQAVPLGGFSETEAPQPSSVYSNTKLLGERFVADWCHSGNQGAILRSSLLYGPFAGRTGGPLHWIFRAISQGLPVRAFFDEWRTPVYVDDLVEIILHMILEKRPGLFHCGGPERVSRVDFLLKLFNIFEFPNSLLLPTSRLEEPGPPRPKDVSLNSTKLHKELGIHTIGYEEGLEQVKRERIS